MWALGVLAGLVGAGVALAQPVPRMSALPPLAVRPDAPSPQLRAAEAAVRRVMRIRLQRPPARLNMEKFNFWARTRFVPWINRRREAMEVAETLLQQLAQAGQPRDLVIGGALVGLMHEDFAAQVFSMPRPLAIRTDPQLAQVYDDMLAGAMAPMLRRAIDTYEFCQQRGGAPDWSELCGQRLAVLRANGRAPL